MGHTSILVVFLAQPTTVTPESANCLAVSYPMPDDAPVTSATLPFHLLMPPSILRTARRDARGIDTPIFPMRMLTFHPADAQCGGIVWAENEDTYKDNTPTTANSRGISTNYTAWVLVRKRKKGVCGYYIYTLGVVWVLESAPQCVAYLSWPCLPVFVH